MGHLDQTRRPQSVFLAFCMLPCLTLAKEIAALFGLVFFSSYQCYTNRGAQIHPRNGQPSLPTLSLFTLITLPQGMSVVTFDWSQIAYVFHSYGIHHRLTIPTLDISVPPSRHPVCFVDIPSHHPTHSVHFIGWAEANVFAGFLFFFCTSTHPYMRLNSHQIVSGFLTPILYVRILSPSFPHRCSTQAPVHKYVVCAVHAVSFPHLSFIARFADGRILLQHLVPHVVRQPEAPIQCYSHSQGRFYVRHRGLPCIQPALFVVRIPHSVSKPLKLNPLQHHFRYFLRVNPHLTLFFFVLFLHDDSLYTFTDSRSPPSQVFVA